MPRPSPFAIFARRTAAGEIAPIPDFGPSDTNAKKAILAQLECRAAQSPADPCPDVPFLEDVRRAFSEFAVCEKPALLSHVRPDDSFPAVRDALLDDTACHADLTLLLGLVSGRLDDREIRACRTIGDLAAAMANAAREARPKPTPTDFRRLGRRVRRNFTLGVFLSIAAILVLFRLTVLVFRLRSTL